jgi:hypothetical protein
MLSLRVPFLLPGVFAFAGLAAAFATSIALAQSAPSADAVAGASTQAPAVVAQPSAATAQSDSIDSQIAAWTQAPPGDAAAAGGVAPPRQIHGEAGVSVGSSGYRSGYVSADIPIGKDSDLGIAVGESEFKPKHFGTIKDQSLAISLRIGNGGNSPPPACAGETLPVDGRYLEPLWVAHERGAQLARDQQNCGPPVVNRGVVEN